VSIINEALKKAQQSRKVEKEKQRVQAKAKSNSTTDFSSKPAPTLKPQPIEKKSEPTKRSDFIFTWKMASIVTVLGLLVIMATQNYQREHAVNTPVVDAAAKPQNKVKITFDGVFLADDMRVALINKQSMHIGDILNGMKIVAINQDTIDLQGDTGIIQLRAGATYLL
jgi:hypothetical protein